MSQWQELGAADDTVYIQVESAEYLHSAQFLFFIQSGIPGLGNGAAHSTHSSHLN